MLAGFVIAASKLLGAAHDAISRQPVDVVASDTPKAKGKDKGAEEDEEREEANSEPPVNPQLGRALLANSAWCDFKGSGDAWDDEAPLELLSKECEGDLGGPRAQPEPDVLLEGSELSRLAGGGLISGQDILAFLQNLSLTGNGGGGASWS
jgi:hypothetical protein